MHTFFVLLGIHFLNQFVTLKWSQLLSFELHGLWMNKNEYLKTPDDFTYFLHIQITLLCIVHLNIGFFITHIPCFQWQWVEWFVVIQGMHFHSHSLLGKITKFNSAIIYEIEFGNSKLKVENFCNTSQEFSEEILILLNSTLTIWICSIWGAAVICNIYMNILNILNIYLIYMTIYYIIIWVLIFVAFNTHNFDDKRKLYKDE